MSDLELRDEQQANIADPYPDIIEEEEDNDGHGKGGHHDEGNSSYKTASLHIINTIMGSGILALPIVFKNLGIILGFLFIFSIALVNTFSVTLLLKCKEMTKRT